MRYTWHLDDGDKHYGFDIDLAGLHEQRLRKLDDLRAVSAGRSIGSIPFGQPRFHSPQIVDGVTWIDIGSPDEPGHDGPGGSA